MGTAHAAPETVAEYGTDAGQVSKPLGAVVDSSSGDLYITEGNNFRISKFDLEGNFLFAFGYGVADGVTHALQTCGPQASPPSKHCFAPNFGSPVLNPRSVAVDNSAGPSHGDVYVSEPHRISKFTSSGQLIFVLGRNVNETKVAEVGATQAEKNICTAASGDICGQGENGTGANEFSGSLPLAVDPAGVVWVGDFERLCSFDSSGSPSAEVGLSGAGDTQSLALDSSGNFYVRSESLPGVRKLQAGSAALLETLDAGGGPRSVALDENDDVYIGDATSPYRFKVYNPAGEQTAQFGAGQVIGAPGDGVFFGTNGIAVAKSAGKLFSASSRSESESIVQAFPLPEPGPLPENQHVVNLLPTTVTLAAELNPEGDPTTYHFEYDTNPYGDDEASHGTSVPVPEGNSAGEDFDSEEVAVNLEELIPSTTYHFRLCATNVAGTVCGADTTFMTRPAVVIEPEWASNLSAHSAQVHAEMDPLGVEAEAWLEYGADESYGQVLPLPNLGESFASVLRQATLSGLQAATTYHFRFAARDSRDGNVYTVHGPDRIFTTQMGGLDFQLPDERAWEMVSPADKHGARLFAGPGVHLQASVDGNNLGFQSILSTESDPDGNRALEPSMNLALRQADGSWSSKDITSPNQVVTQLAAGVGNEYKLFNSDLSEALLDPRSGTPLSSEASPEQTPYLRQNTEPPVYTPLVTTKEPYANVPLGTEFGNRTASVSGVQLAAVSLDFRHFGLRSTVPLVQDVPAVEETLYEWSGGRIQPISVLPPSEGSESGALVRANFGSVVSVDGALSMDGSRAFWSTGDALYLRYNATQGASALSGGTCTEPEKACTVQIDVKRPGVRSVGTPSPLFQGASADGTAVFFTDTEQLTEDASSQGADLYRCELPAGSAAGGCVSLIDLSAPTGAGENAEVQGVAATFTADGSMIYFVANGVLDKAPNKFGDAAISGQPNLYLWQRGEGVRFIATLTDEDSTDWGHTLGFSQPLNGAWLTVTASPSGRYLAFMSQRSLTGYDNRSESGGQAAKEVFRYDAVAEFLSCVSCNPTQGRPHAALIPNDKAHSAFVNPLNLWQEQERLAAAALPEATELTEATGLSFYRPRAVLDNGRVFFNAIDSLVPADSNGQWDVYQFEPTGVGDCSAASGAASIAPAAGGCVSLISSGTAEEEAAFVDADETGDNVFFWSPAQLSVLDEDQEVDIYDARVGGVAATRPAHAECLGEACQPAAQAPNDPTPASSAFKGPGNVKKAPRRCAKGKRHVRRRGKVRCIARKHKHDGGKSRRVHR
ncbi:MAG TPA: NHL repeat-containing protein [Solirubrobacterales bacterium]|nr:NHL repeat-containing protein [Solirubrobacterales bacterium]